MFQTEIALPRGPAEDRNQAVLKRCNTIETDSIDRKTVEVCERDMLHCVVLMRSDRRACQRLQAVRGAGQRLVRHCAPGRAGRPELRHEVPVEEEAQAQGLWFARVHGQCGMVNVCAAARKAPGKDDGLSELNQEIAILKKLTHAHIVRLVEVMNDPSHDIVYMVFELMPLGLSRVPCPSRLMLHRASHEHERQEHQAVRREAGVSVLPPAHSGR